jgi:hypothetical protein
MQKTTKELNLLVLGMIEEILPKTSMRNNQKLLSVIKTVKEELEK